MGARPVAWLLVSASLAWPLSACGDGDAPPAASRAQTSQTNPPAASIPVAGELAPSQLSASTVPEPEAPPPCEVEHLRFESPAPATGWSPFGAVVHITNAGAARCEVAVFESPSVDPLMEPDVWIDPGTTAELLVEPSSSSCEQPAPVTAIDLVVNGTPVVVPVSIGETCGVMLTAIYAVEPSG
jgi:hypothetical protein